MCFGHGGRDSSVSNISITHIVHPRDQIVTESFLGVLQNALKHGKHIQQLRYRASGYFGKAAQRKLGFYEVDNFRTSYNYNSEIEKNDWALIIQLPGESILQLLHLFMSFN